MEIYRCEDGSGIRVTGLGGYSLEDTLECGQCFRFDKAGDGYFGVVGRMAIYVSQPARGELVFMGVDESDVRASLVPYFALDTDWDAIALSIRDGASDEWMRSAASAAGGIAILRQDPWEALASFIISQNNNIPRIKKIIRSLCASYGEELARGRCPEGRECDRCGRCCTFPSAGAILAHPERLHDAHMGFRERYILDAARRVESGETDLAAIRQMNDADCEAALEEIVGVGKKVANCVMLFGLGHLAAFPIDVWMKRAINEYFGGHLDPSSFGEHAGVAQQYIFHYARITDRKASKEEV